MGAKKKEMERLVKIFTGCIEQHENYELLYSKKLACYLLLELNSYRKDVEATEMCIRDSSEFEHDEPDEQEQVEMRRSLGVYMEQLPEYKYLADEVLEGYGVVD